MQKKRGAIDLSVGTIVIVVLGVLILIMGIGMVSKIGCSAVRGMQVLDDETKEQLFGMFNQDSKLAIKEMKNEIRKDITYNVGFGIQDDDGGSATYSYIVEASDLGICNFSKTEAENFIVLGRNVENIQFVGKYAGLITFFISTENQNCILKYRIVVNKNGNLYDAKEFQVSILNKGILKTFC